jgi:cysteinyl-tRNA synthetase
MLRLYDTLSRKKKIFKPLKDNLVRIYTCGPSVYAYSHIGNFRTYLFEDILVRYLIYKGFRVKRVMNITDIEDKAIEAANMEGVSLCSLQRGKIRAFLRDFDNLGMMRPDIIAKASDHVPQMIKLIERICENGYCYKEKDCIFFQTRKFKKYGSLAHLRSPRYLGIMKKDDYSRVGIWDFHLWNAWSKSDGPAFWRSPFGKGRPGWHIECSAMSMHYLGESFDIHCGGTDNIFPHHENEIAQSESATGKRLANFWMHAKHLTIGKRKMSKRTGNVLYVRQLEKDEGIKPRCLRFYLLCEKYRHPLDFTLLQFKKEICDCERIRKLITQLKRIRIKGQAGLGKRLSNSLISSFEKYMDDDLDTKCALKAIFRIGNEIDFELRKKRLNKQDAKYLLKAFSRIDSVLGVF